MSTFTRPLKYVLEALYGVTMDVSDYEVERGSFTFNGVTYDDLPILPENGRALGLAQYPIFNEAYRPILNGKIVDEYYNREIGMETIDDFKLVFRRTMQQIMPYYNQLYVSETFPYEPLQTMDIHSVGQSSIEGTESSSSTAIGNSTTKSGARAVKSDTPQTMLAGDGDYATNATDTNSTVNGDSLAENTAINESDTSNNSDNRVTGFQGIASNLMVQYRNSLINIDGLILKSTELQECFMQVLNNGDSYTQTPLYYGRNY